MEIRKQVDCVSKNRQHSVTCTCAMLNMAGLQGQAAQSCRGGGPNPSSYIIVLPGSVQIIVKHTLCPPLWISLQWGPEAASIMVDGKLIPLPDENTLLNEPM